MKEGNITGALARKIEQQGILKGKAEGKKEIAQVMLQEGVDLNFISKITGISLEEINQLKQELK